MAGALKRLGLTNAALEHYERERAEAIANMVLASRSHSPDAILRVVHERSGGRPFRDIEDMAPVAELQAISDNYKRIAGYDPAPLRARPSLV